MATHGLIINSSFVSGTGALLQASTPIVLVGTSATGTDNQIIRVRTSSDLEQFGDGATGTIVKNLEILQSYGCNNIYVVKVPTGVDSAATAINIIGSNNAGVKTGIELVRDIWTLYRQKPDLILIPGFNTDTVLTSALNVASDINVDALVLSNFTLGTSTATATTTRNGSTGLGTKNARLIPGMPHVKNSQDEWTELSTHLAGLLAKTTLEKGYGYSPSNKYLVDAQSIEEGFTLSYVDDDADNQKLEDIGVFTVNQNVDGFVGWGNRNALYSDENQTIETYIVLQRVKTILNGEFEKVQQKYIDEPCNYGTAKILETALKNIISMNGTIGNLDPSSTAMLNLSKTSFPNRLLAYDIYIVMTMPTETIEANIQYVVEV